MANRKQLLDVIAIQAELVKLGLDLGATMALVVERTLGLVGADGAAIELAEGDEMVYRAASGIAAAQLGLRLKRENSLSGLCVRVGKPLRCTDTEEDVRVDREACRRVGLRSMIVMPLVHGGDSVGVLKAMSARAGDFDSDDVKVLGLLSEVVGAAMYFATKYDGDALFHRATHDAMTGLANRSLFIDRLRNVVAQQRRQERTAGVLMIDMDGLKKINDTYGHRAGDAAITAFAQRLKACVRDSDTVARLGGDEFGVVLMPVDLPAASSRLAQRIGTSIAEPILFEGHALTLSASIGVAEYPGDGEEIDQLLEVADQRMYRMKRHHHERQGMVAS